MSTSPNTSQVDRDRLADPDLPDLDDRVGTGDSAEHDDEVTPS